MEELYKKILKKPKAYRKRLAYILTLIFGLVFFSLWMFITMDKLKKDLGDVSPRETLKKQIPSLREEYQKQTGETLDIKKELENLGY